jgi:hypothetical protein
MSITPPVNTENYVLKNKLLCRARRHQVYGVISKKLIGSRPSTLQTRQNMYIFLFLFRTKPRLLCV